jgi:glyoxylase-like metal-dependent hydrolase (beta-lactamase superfamily II)
MLEFQEEVIQLMRKILFFSFLSTAVALASISAAQAQPPQGPPPQGAGQQGPPQGMQGPPMMPVGPLTVHQLTPTVYWAQGGIGNTGFIVGDKGVIVIDTTMSPVTAKELIADVAKVTPKPVTTVILTHGDMDHVGGLSAFPKGLTIIAQENNKKSMEAGIAEGRSRVPADHLPNHTVANKEDIEIDGVKLELLHWAPAHTSGDLVIYIPAQKIVFTGDIIVMDQPRALIHREQQGTSEGWIETAKGILALDADRFVVGHGDVQSKESVQKRYDLVVAERDKIKELVAKGMTLDQIKVAVGDPPAGQAKSGPGGPRFTDFSEVVYQELTEKK